MVDPFGLRHLQLHLRLGDGRRQCRLYRRRPGRHRRHAMTDLSAFSLEGMRIAVTGANTGIGQGIAVAVARAGGAVVGISRSGMDETAALVEAQGGAFEPVRADLSDASVAVATLERVMADGPLDGLVNSAGIVRRGAAVDCAGEGWDAVLDTNVRWLCFLCPVYGKHRMAANLPGRIVDIASLLSLQAGIRVCS